MTPARLEIPAGQNWSCHGCTDCCRHHFVVSLSPAEKNRIEQQGWTAGEGVDPDRMIVAGLNQHRLGHQPDGACVFLGPDRRCRIHAKFGEAAKPLACRLYPLLLFPAGKKVFVGLRFSCPSAAANQGRPLLEIGAQATGLAREVLPEGAEKLPPPGVGLNPGLDWPDFLRFIRWIEATLAVREVPIALKLLRCLQWLESVERGYFDKITGETADEILEALVRRSAEKLPALPPPGAPPSRFGRVFLRLMVLEHARATTVADRAVHSTHRWKLLAAAAQFIAAFGHTPVVRGELKSAPFAGVERIEGALPPGAAGLLDRYFRVKVQSLQFCAKGFHDVGLIEGFRNLALMYPVIIWLARWRAAGEGRSSLADADVQLAVSIADYQYGFAPYLRWRTRLLQQRHDVERLVAWYARE